MQLKIIDHITTNIYEDWLRLWENSNFANCVNSPAWLKSVIDTFKYKHYKIILIYDQKELVAASGLIQVKKYGTNFYSLPPKDFVYGNPFLIDLNNRKVVEIFCQALNQIGNIFLENVPFELTDKLKLYIKQLDAYNSTINYLLHIQADEKGQPLIPNRKKFMKRVKHNQNDFKIKSYDGSSYSALEQVFQIDNNGRKQSRGYGTFSNSKIKQLYIALAKNFSKYFSINLLYFQNTPIAYNMGFIINKTYYGNQISFINEYAKYFPGKVLMVKFIDAKWAKKVNKIDFGSGDSFFKSSFADQSRPLYNLVISKSLLFRTITKIINKNKEFLFKNLSNHPRIYSLYRKIKNII